MKVFALWFTGLPASGKSSIAEAVQARLQREGGTFAKIIDGDEIRQELNYDLGFSVEDRNTNQKRIAYIAKVVNQCGCTAINASISPFFENRAYARELISPVGTFVEIHVDVPTEECERRDQGRGRGLYARARAGELADLTGFHDTEAGRYDVPESPEIRLDAQTLSIEESVDEVFTYLKEKGLHGSAP